MYSKNSSGLRTLPGITPLVIVQGLDRVPVTLTTGTVKLNQEERQAGMWLLYRSSWLSWEEYNETLSKALLVAKTITVIDFLLLSAFVTMFKKPIMQVEHD